MAYSDEVLADSPVGYWRMHEASGTVVDSSGTGNDGDAATGTLSYQQAGPIETETSYSMWFQAGSPLAGQAVPDDPTLDLGDTFTMEAWVKRTRTGQWEKILAKGNGAYAYGFNTSDRIVLDRLDVGTVMQSTITITDTDWHHVVAAKNGSSGAWIYIDGTDVSDSFTDRTCANTATSLWMGNKYSDQDGLQGYLSEVAVYGTALSSTRIIAHYDAAFAPPGAAFVIPHRTI